MAGPGSERCGAEELLLSQGAALTEAEEGFDNLSQGRQQTDETRFQMDYSRKPPSQTTNP